ncbi:MAG: efflux RND transporter periplasmic adaptor subunit [Elusimicrobiota bacterium]
MTALAVAVSGAAYWIHARARVGNDGMTVSYATVKRGSIQDTVETTGEVAPLNRVEIKPAVSGRIESLLVDEGDHVEAGQLLAEMSSTDRVAILDAARAQGPAVYKKWLDVYQPIPIVSPLAGLIILKNVVVGQMVDPTVVIYALSDKLIVIAQVDETDIGRIRVGMKARIVLDAYPNRTVDGRVFDILHEGVNTNNVITYNVKVEPIGGSPVYYKSQMTANIDFIVRQKKNALLLPAAAIVQSGTHSEVMIPGPDGKPQARQVVLGLQSGESCEIASGLDAGQTVMIRRKNYVPRQAQSSPLAFGGKKKN